MDAVFYVLKKYFGHSAFRPGQEALVRSILSGRDTLGILPTGGGKSLCYQVPALLFPGITLVISPLISLMADQVQKLLSLGIPAAYLTSAQTAAERKAILARCIQGCRGNPGTSHRPSVEPFPDFSGYGRETLPRTSAESLLSFSGCGQETLPRPLAEPLSGFSGCGQETLLRSPPRLLYLSPERLLTDEFRNAAKSLHISFVCVDEAHCVSQWGENFRPAYRRIPEFLALLPKRPAFAAFTATATPDVRSDIVRFLRLKEPFVRATGFDRPNLFYRICRVHDKWPALFHLLWKYRGQCGIVYCLTRRTTESVARELCRRGVPAACYHGGMTKEEREAAQAAWLSGEVTVMAATCAFGMGIDKPNVRFVIHYQMPGSVENYYQEAGRAGRDGLPSDCVLLYSFRDVVVNRFFANRDTGEVRRNELRRLLAMRRYAAAKGCHRTWLLRYFGEEAPDFCGKCSHCLRLAIRPAMTPAEKAAEDEDLRKELRALRLRLSRQISNKARRGETDSPPPLANRSRPVILSEAKNLSPPPLANRTLPKAAKFFPRLCKKIRQRLPFRKPLLPYQIFPDGVIRDLAHLRPKNRLQFLLIENAGFFHVLRYARPFLEEIRMFEETR